jgi:hypothetical protein
MRQQQAPEYWPGVACVESRASSGLRRVAWKATFMTYTALNVAFQASGWGYAGTGSLPGISVGWEMEIRAVSGISRIGMIAIAAAPIR